MLSKILTAAFFVYEITSAKIARAVFDLNVTGEVTVTDSTIMVNIDLSRLDSSLLPVPDCLTNGLKYHIHEKWAFGSEDTQSKVGVISCGKNTTGGHYDPWAACAPQSGNIYCSVNGGCVNSSAYLCNSTIYQNNPYACEVGDWSGKYGILKLDTLNRTSRNDSSFWEIDAEEIVNKSVVFHCNTAAAERAFCAQFRVTSDENPNNNLKQIGSVPGVIADFSEVLQTPSTITMIEDGTYQVSLDVTKINVTCPILNYRIYDTWTSDKPSLLGGSSCAPAIGDFYDPTKTCLPSSDEKYCITGKLCNSTSWTYSCNYNADPYMCSPSDLSGKWGPLNNTLKMLEINGKDDLLPPLDKLVGKSIALLCQDDLVSIDSTLIACAELVDVLSFTTTESSDTTLSPDGTTKSPDDNAAYYNGIVISFYVTIIASFFFFL